MEEAVASLCCDGWDGGAEVKRTSDRTVSWFFFLVVGVAIGWGIVEVLVPK